MIQLGMVVCAYNLSSLPRNIMSSSSDGLDSEILYSFKKSILNTIYEK